MDLPTYTSIWRIEKRLYKLYDFRLPMPLPIGQITVFTAIAVPYVVLLEVLGLSFSHTLIWLYILPPGVLTWLATRPVLESKRLPELIKSQLRYLAEPRLWCRMAPLSERDVVVVTGRVWRTARVARRRPSPVAPPASARPGPARPASARRASARPSAAPAPARPSAPPAGRRSLVAGLRRSGAAAASGAAPVTSAGLSAWEAGQRGRPARGTAGLSSARSPGAPVGPVPGWPARQTGAYSARSAGYPSARVPAPVRMPATARQAEAHQAGLAGPFHVPSADQDELSAADCWQARVSSASAGPGRPPASHPTTPDLADHALAGPDPARCDLIGADVADPDSAGLDRTGPASAGLDRTGPDSAGPDAAGHDAASPDLTGPAEPDAVPRPASPATAQAIERVPPVPQRPIITVVGAGPAKAAPPTVERALAGPSARRGDARADRVTVVPGGHRPGKPDQLQRDRARAQRPIGGPSRIVVLGCTVGAGQTITALLTAEVLASLRSDQVAVLDLNPGAGALARRALARPALSQAASLGPSRLAVLRPQGAGAVADDDAVAAGDADDDEFSLVTRPDPAHDAMTFEAASEQFDLVLADPSTGAVPRLLTIADQLVLVAPASAAAASAIAMTFEWLEAHGQAGLAASAIMVLNGVSRRSLPHVDQAERVCVGRCRAIVRVPWDDQLNGQAAHRAHHAAPGSPTHQHWAGLLSPGTAAAYTALAGVLVAALADRDPADRDPAGRDPVGRAPGYAHEPARLGQARR